MTGTKHFLLFISLIALGFSANSQAPKPAAVKPLKLTTKFAAYADSSKPFLTDFKQILKADLKVTDNNGGTWTIVTYRLGWRRKEVNDDYKTGQRKTIFQFYAKTVDNSSKIPAEWQKEMSEGLQAGEHLLFEEIIVQNPKTKKMMQAPPLHLLMK
jgi:hypothetical protein